MIADDLFNKFACYVEKYYKIEQFGDIIWVFIRLEYNNWSNLFEVPKLDF